MAMVMDQQQRQQQEQQQQQPQQQVYKHYCRVCKKGFGCGRALGGHMRAHGINDDTMASHDDPDVDEPSGCGAGASDWDDKLSSPPTKRMYALRTNPNRLKTCRVCENCGKEFFSWKSFLEHGKCSSDDEDVDDDYFASPQRSDADEDLAGHAGCAGWSKGKRSRRAKMIGCGSGGNASVPPPNCPSREEEDLANCLVMLSASRVEPMAIVEAEESCASASKEQAQDHPRQPMFSFSPVVVLEKFKAPASAAAPSAPRGMFECKACKKVFTSHQALGGHRASHKKVKGCFAAKIAGTDEAAPEDDAFARDNASTSAETASMVTMSMAIVPFDNPAPLSVAAPLRKKSRVHECSICHRVFSSGQALGGHKRCHWITSNLPDPAFKLLPVPDHANVLQHQLTLARSFESLDSVLDLNLPASAAAADDAAVVRQDVGSPMRLDVPAAVLLQHLVTHNNNNNNKSKDVASGSSNNNNIINNNNDVLSNKDENMNEGSNVNNNNINNDVDNNTTDNNMDDEVESKAKIAKLSDLKDINMGDESSPWLQVGIGPSANETSTDP